jgi:acetyl-CoA synthetase
MADNSSITSVLKEDRVFKPSAGFRKQAHIKSFAEYKKIHAAALKNPEKFWASKAKELHWFKPWKRC